MSVTASVGPISGIDYGSLINGLISLDQQPIDQLSTRLGNLTNQQNALTDLSTQMTALKISAANFTSSSIFRSAAATSANPNVVTATAGVGTPTGTYSFNVQRLASASQMVTQGFANTTTALGLSGNIVMQLGGGVLNDPAKLTQLNGGSGVARGSIRLTDASGASTIVDLSHAVDINDVVNAINSSGTTSVLASVDGDHLKLTDSSGGTGSLAVTNVGGTTTASDLGLTGASSGGVLTGASLTKMNGATSLDSLNDGLGVRNAGILSDFSIATGSATIPVSLNGAKTVGDVIAKINSLGQSSGITAAISADGNGITLTDQNGGPVTVSALNGSMAAADLGIQGTSAGGTLAGDRITSSLEGPLLKNLNGGNQGQSGEVTPIPGTITINSTTVDLSAARSLDDVIQAINNSGAGVTAALDNAGTGLTLSSNAPSFSVADGSGNLASFLHISGTSTSSATGSALSSGDLHLAYASQNTLLSNLNGGSGVTTGQVRFTDGNGKALTLDFTGNTVNTLGDVISKINSAGLALSARINDTGDGILLTQTGGTLAATVQDIGTGTMAQNLGLSGTFSANQMNGSQQKTIAIASTDTLNDVAKKINDAGVGVAASVLNDGSGGTPYRLSLSSRNSGQAGRLVFDGSAAGLNMTTLVQGQDAVMIYGGNANGTGGLLATNHTNTFTGLVPSLAVTLTGVGNSTITVNNDPSKITDAVQTFVDNYNKVISTIATDTAFNAQDQTQNGILFGNSTVQQLQNAMGQFIARSFSGVGSFRTITAMGITVNQDGTLSLDTSALSQVLATNPDDVRNFFTTNTKAVAADLTTNPPTAAQPAVEGFGATLSDMVTRYTDAQVGILFTASDAITNQETQLKKQQTDLATLLVAKRNRLTQQFANLESTIAGLKNQGTALNSLTATTSSSKS
ncbi:MAG TPA: flagellar filament capping protein FliD [Phycisphaerae bacterium]|nr:flagellar filament capping protein FliD [Phycisphaerae bacterium]